MLSVTRVHKNSCWHFQKRRIDVWIQLFVTSLLLFVLSVDSAGVADDSHPVESELFCEKAGGTEPSASWNPTWDSPPPRLCLPAPPLPGVTVPLGSSWTDGCRLKACTYQVRRSPALLLVGGVLEELVILPCCFKRAEGKHSYRYLEQEGELQR